MKRFLIFSLTLALVGGVLLEKAESSIKAVNNDRIAMLEGV